jgi:hypothetical protein
MPKDAERAPEIDNSDEDKLDLATPVASPE